MIAAAVLLCGVFSSSAGPVSQWGGGNVGGLLLFNEPMVDLISVDTQVRIRRDEADVRLRYVLRSRAGARQVQVGIPVVMRSVEKDGDAPPPSPFKDAHVLVAGKEVKTSTTIEATREQYACSAPIEGMPQGAPRAHILRASIVLNAEGSTTVEVRFFTPLMHDDWRGDDGNVLRSARSFCIQLKPPLGFAGLAKGKARWDVKLDDVVGVPIVTPGKEGKPGEHAWSSEEMELRSVPDLVVRIDPA